MERIVIAQYDYGKLLGRIKERGETQESVADAIGKSSVTLNMKVNNKSEFTQKEIENICEYLAINYEDIPQYFFAH